VEICRKYSFLHSQKVPSVLHYGALSLSVNHLSSFHFLLYSHSYFSLFIVLNFMFVVRLFFVASLTILSNNSDIICSYIHLIAYIFSSHRKNTNSIYLSKYYLYKANYCLLNNFESKILVYNYFLFLSQNVHFFSTRTD